MREILFRGQIRKKGEKVTIGGEPVAGKWIYGGIFAPNIQCDRCIITSYDYLQKYLVYADTVGQYTGLTDKNGVKIFEGDIIKNADGIYAVEYCKYLTRFALVHDGLVSGRTVNSGVVIGNIYDDPELLKGEQN